MGCIHFFIKGEAEMAPNDAPSAMRIDLYSHGITVSKFNYQAQAMLLDFCRNLAEFHQVRVGPGQFKREMKCIYAGANRDRSVFYFHRNQLDELIQFLVARGMWRDSIHVIEHPLFEPTKVEFTLRDLRPPKPYQIPIIKYLVEKGLSKLVTLQTGKGKTFIALQAVQQIGERTMLVVKAMYMDKWKEDVSEAYVLEKGDLIILRGAEHLAAVIEQGKQGTLKAKFIMCSLTTMRNYIKAYEHETIEREFYDCEPIDFYKTIGAGVRVIDEAHQEYHMVYRQDLHTHIPKTISLTATLEADSPFLNRMFKMHWPLAMRAPEVEYDKFIAMIGLLYSIEEPGRVRYKNFLRQYSHMEFEKSIIRNPRMLKNYLEMIEGIVDLRFTSVYDKGQSCLIFCSTIQMCTLVRDHLQKVWPHINVTRYVQDDDYEKDFRGGEIVVSTLGSAGTAVDKPNLRVTVMTVGYSARQGNIQAVGRTRKLKDWPDVTPEFVFLAAREIDKQMQYAEEKKHKLDGKVKSFAMLETHYRV